MIDRAVAGADGEASADCLGDVALCLYHRAFQLLPPAKLWLLDESFCITMSVFHNSVWSLTDETPKTWRIHC